MSNETFEERTYNGNCHCGLVKLKLKYRPLEKTRPCRCNCSICTKNGYLLIYPKREDVEFISGEDKMTAYKFGLRNKPHRFCATCGTSILIDFQNSDVESQRKHLAVNVSGWVAITPAPILTEAHSSAFWKTLRNWYPISTITTSMGKANWAHLIVFLPEFVCTISG